MPASSSTACDCSKDEIARAIGEKPVVIKPNLVAIDQQLAATPARGVEGILEFLRSIGKHRNVIIAESAANGPTVEGYSNYGYMPVARKYGARLVDLDGTEVETIYAVDQNDMRPHPIRAARLLLDRGNFVISAAKIKTHDRVVATLSLKNIVVGAPDQGSGVPLGPRRQARRHDRQAHRPRQRLPWAPVQPLRPGPEAPPRPRRDRRLPGDGGQRARGGHAGGARVAVASLDWLAADRVAVALMGIDLAKMGYLNYCAAAGMGEADLDRMEILGERVADHVRTLPPGRQRRPAARMDEAAAGVSGRLPTRNLSRTSPRVRAGFSWLYGVRDPLPEPRVVGVDLEGRQGRERRGLGTGRDQIEQEVGGRGKAEHDHGQQQRLAKHDRGLLVPEGSQGVESLGQPRPAQREDGGLARGISWRLEVTGHEREVFLRCSRQAIR